MLSNLYFCIGLNTLFALNNYLLAVVICFQICIFVLGWTPYLINSFKALQLWFAFKFVFLYWVEHRYIIIASIKSCCDLLSNLYFCIGLNTQSNLMLIRSYVVICFQICIFVLGWTPKISIAICYYKLWFAFKFVFLYWVEHLLFKYINAFLRCDLLSNLYFCIGLNTNIYYKYNTHYVVICFQICIFVLGWTPEQYSNKFKTSCDLLSNLYFCIGLNT